MTPSPDTLIPILTLPALGQPHSADLLVSLSVLESQTQTLRTLALSLFLSFILGPSGKKRRTWVLVLGFLQHLATS